MFRIQGPVRYLLVVAAIQLTVEPGVATEGVVVANPDFALQGEYLGPIRFGLSSQQAGLQVVALGDGTFRGVLLIGGLPGAGWDRRTEFPLSGETRNGAAVLHTSQAPELMVEVHPGPQGRARVIGAGGVQIADLPRIHRISPTLGAHPPAQSIILFDGSASTQLEGAQRTSDRLLKAGATTAMPVGDFQLHVEFRTPFMPSARGQARGNSGVYVQRRYEVQILDSFGLKGVENECGALYRQQRPDVNMCFPPLSWQTYDIWFIAARWDDAGQKIANARITVLHNGVPVHTDRELPDKTGAGQPESPADLPIHFQFHGDAVHYRNLWLVRETPSQAIDPSLACRPRPPAEFSLPLLSGSPNIRSSSSLLSRCSDSTASSGTQATGCRLPGELHAYAADTPCCRCSGDRLVGTGRLRGREVGVRAAQRRRALFP